MQDLSLFDPVNADNLHLVILLFKKITKIAKV